MRRFTAALLFATTPLFAQMHKVQRADAVTRAVGVYEWTGDLTKPTASRLIPVSLFIDGHYEDAGIYLAQPVPMALESSTLYQLQTAGVGKGFINLSYARNLRAAGGVNLAAYDEGWFGYGKYFVPKPPKPIKITDRQGDAHVVEEAKNKEKPDPERPTLQREDDKPGKEKKPKDVSSVSSVPSSPDEDDPDRPMLHRHDSPTPPKEAGEGVTDTRGSVLSDPDRPQIRRGRPADSTTAEEMPRMVGLPEGLHQSAAVSDAVDRPIHDFAHSFSSPEERKDVLQQMEALARQVLADPSLAAQMANPTATPDNSLLKLARLADGTSSATPTAATTKAVSTQKGTTTHARRTRSKAASKPQPPAQVMLEEEQLAAYDLAYNSTPNYIFTAHTAGTGNTLRYVTVVAQPDTLNGMQPVMRLLTDAAHLDRVPRMRLIDAVDADASNRASLLFELRAQHGRQFALYRIYAGRATQVFLTGSMQ